MWRQCDLSQQLEVPWLGSPEFRLGSVATSAPQLLSLFILLPGVFTKARVSFAPAGLWSGSVGQAKPAGRPLLGG